MMNRRVSLQVFYTFVLGLLMLLFFSILLFYFLRTIQIKNLLVEYRNSILVDLVSSYQSIDLTKYAPLDKEGLFLGDSRRLSSLKLLSRENMFKSERVDFKDQKKKIDFVYKKYIENVLPLLWKGGVRDEEGEWTVCQIEQNGKTHFVKEGDELSGYFIHEVQQGYIRLKDQKTDRFLKLFFNKKSYYAPPEALICYIMSGKERSISDGDVVSGMRVEAISSTYLVLYDQGKKIFLEKVSSVGQEVEEEVEGGEL